MKTWANVLFPACIISTTPASAVPTAEAQDSSAATVTESVQVTASPKAVWEALRKHRLITPGRKLVSYKENQAVISEEFVKLPVLGSANILYTETEHPMSEIDYKLIRSDKIKQFEGSWKLLPTDDRKHTLLQLTTRTDTGIHMPFSGMLTRKNTRQRAKQRLSEIKALAESVTRS